MPRLTRAGVHIAGLKAEGLGEGGPALVGKGHVLPGPLVLLRPVQQGDLQLGHALVHLGVVAALAHLRAISSQMPGMRGSSLWAL